MEKNFEDYPFKRSPEIKAIKNKAIDRQNSQGSLDKILQKITWREVRLKDQGGFSTQKVNKSKFNCGRQISGETPVGSIDSSLISMEQDIE